MSEIGRWQLRVAEPRDTDALADLNLECFEPEFNLGSLLGRGYLRVMFRWMIDQEWIALLVAEEDGRLVAAMAAADRSYTAEMLRGCFGAVLRAVLRRPTLLLHERFRERFLRRGARPPKIEPAQVVLVMITPSYRGTPLFPTLVRAVEDRCRERGLPGLGGYAHKRNLASLRAFSRMGWEDCPELETEDSRFLAIRFNENERDR